MDAKLAEDASFIDYVMYVVVAIGLAPQIFIPILFVVAILVLCLIGMVIRSIFSSRGFTEHGEYDLKPRGDGFTPPSY